MSKSSAVLLLITVSATILVESKDGSSTGCSSSEHDCGDGICLGLEMICDGTNDCENESDEQNCGDDYGCGADEFDCKDDVCIENTQICDRVQDCNDGSDEMNCNYTTTSATTTTVSTTTTTTTISTTTTLSPDTTTEDYDYDECSETEFTCNDGFCLSPEAVCDGTPNCFFGEDEDEDNCKSAVQNPEEKSRRKSTGIAPKFFPYVPRRSGIRSAYYGNIDRKLLRKVIQKILTKKIRGRKAAAINSDITTSPSTLEVPTSSTLISKILTQAEGCLYKEEWYPSGADIERHNCSGIMCKSGKVIKWKDTGCAACLSANPNSVILLTLALVIMLLNVR